MDADSVPVYTMPRMKTYLENNGPWSQLVNNKNIALKPIFNAEVTQLDSQLSFYPLQVVHRDEYSETVGFVIQGPNKKALFIPDIDKWEKWEMDIKELIKSVDYAFLDGTFFDASEINHRDISEIPHPFVIESMELFRDLPEADKAKIHYIHFNHTNSLLNSANHQYGKVKKAGFNIAELGMVFEM
jgi:pyrroloquinoline quinone biosynthesis protein B